MAGFFDRVREYIKIKVQQIKLDLMGHLARVMGHVLTLAFLLFLGLFFFLFVSLAIGALLNEVLDSNYYGFLIVAGFYLLLFVLIAILAKRGSIQRWIEAAILHASDKTEEENE